MSVGTPEQGDVKAVESLEIYKHPTCATTTQLPEVCEQIKQVDPRGWGFNTYSYSSDSQSMGTSCGEDYHRSSLGWLAMGEGLSHQQRKKIRKFLGDKKLDFFTGWVGCPILLAILGVITGFIFNASLIVCGGVAGGLGFVLGFGPAEQLRAKLLKSRIVKKNR